MDSTKICPCYGKVDRIRWLDGTNLKGHLKGAGFTGCKIIKPKNARLGVEPTYHQFLRIGRCNANTVCPIQIVCQPRSIVTVGQTQTTGQRSSRAIQIFDVVIDKMEEIAQFIIGGGLCARSASPKTVIKRRQLLPVKPLPGSRATPS